jgi:hypothetical protein
MLLKSNKVSGNFPPLQNIINDQNLEEFAYDDEEKYDLLNKYFSFISKLDYTVSLFFIFTNIRVSMIF